jgi:hypothetical protein
MAQHRKVRFGSRENVKRYLVLKPFGTFEIGDTFETTNKYKALIYKKDNKIRVTSFKLEGSDLVKEIEIE